MPARLGGNIEALPPPRRQQDDSSGATKPPGTGNSAGDGVPPVQRFFSIAPRTSQPFHLAIMPVGDWEYVPRGVRFTGLRKLDDGRTLRRITEVMLTGIPPRVE